MAEEGQTIIIKKVKKGGHGHHGGAWKVAYADFVTAMMAFFLLLWLLNATTEEQKRGIADYFEPGFRGSSGAGGILGGTSRSEEGKLNQPASSPSVSIPLPTVARTIDDEESAKEDAEAQSEHFDSQPAEDQEELVRRREQEEFARAEHDLRQALQQIPDIRDLAENLIIDETPEGLRIQIVDQDTRPMFQPGGIDPLPRARLLLEKLVEVVKDMPNKISITGHTDSSPLNRIGYSNWELSSDRANATRRIMAQSGLPAGRIASVQGKADTEPLFSDEPTSPRNRRISVVLLRKAQEVRRSNPTPAPPRIVR